MNWIATKDKKPPVGIMVFTATLDKIKGDYTFEPNIWKGDGWDKKVQEEPDLWIYLYPSGYCQDPCNHSEFLDI